MERERDLLRAGTRRLRAWPAAAPSLIGAVGGSPAALAARKPGGTAWGAGEVPMWKRSQVEQLTGLTRHTIQDLCNPNTAGDGLGFWRPAVSKPGYSRFDEGDLLAFYLVRQLTKAGFTLREVEPAVFDLLEDDGSFGRALLRKATTLRRRRAEIDDRLATLEYLEVVVEAPVDDRLYVAMEAALMQSAERAVRASVLELHAKEEDGESVRRGLQGLVVALLGVLRGDDAPSAVREHGIESLVNSWVSSLAGLLGDKSEPDSVEAKLLALDIAHAIADEDANDTQVDLAIRALAAFLGESENGVPVELVFGMGSFEFLARAVLACTSGSDGRT